MNTASLQLISAWVNALIVVIFAPSIVLWFWGGDDHRKSLKPYFLSACATAWIAGIMTPNVWHWGDDKHKQSSVGLPFNDNHPTVLALITIALVAASLVKRTIDKICAFFAARRLQDDGIESPSKTLGDKRKVFGTMYEILVCMAVPLLVVFALLVQPTLSFISRSVPLYQSPMQIGFLMGSNNAYSTNAALEALTFSKAYALGEQMNSTENTYIEPEFNQIVIPSKFSESCFHSKTLVYAADVVFANHSCSMVQASDESSPPPCPEGFFPSNTGHGKPLVFQRVSGAVGSKSFSREVCFADRKHRTWYICTVQYYDGAASVTWEKNPQTGCRIGSIDGLYANKPWNVSRIADDLEELGLVLENARNDVVSTQSYEKPSWLEAQQFAKIYAAATMIRAVNEWNDHTVGHQTTSKSYNTSAWEGKWGDCLQVHPILLWACLFLSLVAVVTVVFEHMTEAVAEVFWGQPEAEQAEGE